MSGGFLYSTIRRSVRKFKLKPMRNGFSNLRALASYSSQSTPSTTARPLRPLDGITVVSLEQAIAAPFCTWQLADLGARVIKIERPEVGDFCRHLDKRVNGMCSHVV